MKCHVAKKYVIEYYEDDFSLFKFKMDELKRLLDLLSVYCFSDSEYSTSFEVLAEELYYAIISLINWNGQDEDFQKSITDFLEQSLDGASLSEVIDCLEEIYLHRDTNNEYIYISFF